MAPMGFFSPPIDKVSGLALSSLNASIRSLVLAELECCLFVSCVAHDFQQVVIQDEVVLAICATLVGLPGHKIS
jgi:hypothetical protein